jgi:hypothetical protein
MSVLIFLSLFLASSLVVGAAGAAVVQLWSRLKRPTKQARRFEIVATIPASDHRDRIRSAIDEAISYLDPDHKPK